MRNLLYILLILPAMLLAAPVDPNMAQQVAQNFINSSGDSLTAQQPISQSRRLRRIAKHTAVSPQYYIFNNEDGGFVIVSGDDCATPILGYSNVGSIDLDNMPIQLQDLLQAYAMEIQEAVDKHLHATDDVAELWEAYKRAPQIHTATTAVNALITTTWNQSPRYNNKCPADASLLLTHGGHATTGCVATAMAQIMKYWEYPKKGYGSKSYRSEYYGTLSANFGSTAYDWDNMPQTLSILTSSVQDDAVATLMYHCGVAVSMNYNCDGHGSSGAGVIDLGGGRASAEAALKTYFGYASTVSGKIWGQSISTSTWSSMLKTELDNQRPILYAGSNPNGGGGHAFICDGYDSNDKFHFNWGWGGQANGFFSLSALTPKNHNYTVGQQAVIGISPADGSSPAKNYDLYMNTDLTAINTSSSTSSEPNAYNFGNKMSFTAQVENNGTGTFSGYLKVGAFTETGDFVAWSNESYRFTLNAGDVTVQKTYTFTGGAPFTPGKYRAYMYYQDVNETQSKLVKTDAGIIWTEYNNIAFTVKSSGSLQIASSYSIYDEPFEGFFTTGMKARINVNVKNNSSSKFYGKIRLGLYNADGTLAELIEDVDYTSSGLPANTSSSLQFYNIIDVDPGTYYLALKAQKNNQTTWPYIGCNTSYLNPISVIVKAPELLADEYESNNTQSMATTLQWGIEPEMEDFSTPKVSLHEDADIDYYKLEFPKTKKYKVEIRLCDKYNKCGWHYENADAQFAYSVGGDPYSEYNKSNKTVTFDGPNTLYISVIQYGMNGLGYYELSGDIEETVRDDIENIFVESKVPTKILHENNIYILREDKIYTVTGQIVK